MNRVVVIVLLVWSIALGAGAYFVGRHAQANADKAQQAQEHEIANEVTRMKNRMSLAAGVRTEKAQAKTEVFFQQLRTDYETDKQNNPGIGCVLDAVGLRRWNEANAESDSDAASQPAAEVPGAAITEAR